MHTKTRLVAILIMALVLLIGVLAPTVTAAPHAQGGTLRIGYLGPADSAMAQGAQLAIDQINSAGGFTAADGNTYQLTLGTLTVHSTAETLAQDVTALTAQNVIALLGPDTNAPLNAQTLQALAGTGLPVLTGATADLLTDDDPADQLFRVRAPERVYSFALASYLVGDLGLSSFVLVQTNIAATEALLDFESALSSAGISVAGKVQLADSSALATQSQAVVGLNPEAVVIWGPPADAALLLQLLRESNWQGVFAMPDVDEAARSGAMPAALIDGVIGVSTWSYAYPSESARIFLEDYLVTFGEIPGPLAAAGYDVIWYLRATMINVGIDPAAIREGLITGAARPLVGGTLRPADFGNGDLIRMAMVYELQAGGGPNVVALFNDTQRLEIEDAGNQ
ncbi:MAG: ABC transporter substrate-binding protein [Anaerolineae bacterium]|nr:ABC transporter substrate-binding protein [Anaerolineae bacterium]